MGTVIRICDPVAMDMNGQYLVEYDPSRPGVSPLGFDLTAHIVTTPDIEKATVFTSAQDAVEFYRKPHGWRADGNPNRPLTAFTVEILPLRKPPQRAGTITVINDRMA